jgi:hypothetical protein
MVFTSVCIRGFYRPLLRGRGSSTGGHTDNEPGAINASLVVMVRWQWYFNGLLLGGRPFEKGVASFLVE